MATVTVRRKIKGCPELMGLCGPLAQGTVRLSLCVAMRFWSAGHLRVGSVWRPAPSLCFRVQACLLYGSFEDLGIKYGQKLPGTEPLRASAPSQGLWFLPFLFLLMEHGTASDLCHTGLSLLWTDLHLSMPRPQWDFWRPQIR